MLALTEDHANSASSPAPAGEVDSSRSDEDGGGLSAIAHSPLPIAPFPSDPWQALRDFLRADIPLIDLADNHGLTPAEFLAFIESPRTQVHLAALTCLAEIQNDTVTILARPAAAASLARHLADHKYEQDHALPTKHATPATIAVTTRARESARRAAATLLRVARRSAPVEPPRPVPARATLPTQDPGHRTQDHPANPARVPAQTPVDWRRLSPGGTMHHRNACTRRARRRLSFLAAAALTAAAGCSSAPPLTYSGFLSDYSALARTSDRRMHYVAPAAHTYRSFIIDPVEADAEKLSEDARAEIAAYFRDAVARVLTDSGYTHATGPGPGTARVRVAITSIHKSTWWLKIHPASSLAGAGRGGATMEGEAVDSMTGEQLAAVIQSGVGSQFTVLNLSTVSDIKSAIDVWAKDVSARLAEHRAATHPPPGPGDAGSGGGGSVEPAADRSTSPS